MNLIDFKAVRSQFQVSGVDKLADDFFFTKVKVGEGGFRFEYPSRFDGFVAAICLNGVMRVELNLKTFELGSHDLLIYLPGNIVKVCEGNEGEEPPEVMFVAASLGLLQDLRIDFAKLFSEGIAILDQPYVQLSQGDMDILAHYYDLMVAITHEKREYLREVVKGLISSVFYLLGSLWNSQPSMGNLPRTTASGRSKMVFESFLQLVNQNHAKERNVSFYADKLYFSPKYFSKLIKEVSGRSAPEWIDSVVVSEAKNLLKYSDLTIKEIAEKLNFSNVSGFHKFFKHNTGMTPKEWRERI